MLPKNETPSAWIISGDDRIASLLTQKESVITPAFACRFDGFVNDTFTEYANPSIYRPASVCDAQLVSTLSDTVSVSGNYYLGFTMYTTAGQNEMVDIHIGHRLVARASISDPDNRLHLFLVPEKFAFKSGESIRLITGKTTGPCRIENIVLLPRKPQITKPRISIITPHVDIRRSENGLIACMTWITNRPATATLQWGNQKSTQTIKCPAAQSNHEVVLTGLTPRRSYRYQIDVIDRTKTLHATHKGRFRADIAQSQSRIKKARFPLQSRRSGAPWPVSIGVPFAKGTLGRTNQLRLLQNRTEIPVQPRALTRWDDGSVKWALLDYHADGQSDYTVEYGRNIKPMRSDKSLDIVESQTGITVTTGPIRIEFRRDHIALPGMVSLCQKDGTYQWITPGNTQSPVVLSDANGQTFYADMAENLVIEEAGPERVCIRLECTHRASANHTCFRSIFRIHLFRNSSLIRVQHTFENNNTDSLFTNINDLVLHADFDLGDTVTGQLEDRPADPAKTPLLQQLHDNAYSLVQGHKTHKDQRASGIAHLSGTKASVTLAVCDFWQNYPKGLGLSNQSFTLQICPPLKKNIYPKGGELEDRLYYALLNGVYKLKQGVSRTHEFWFDIQPGTTKPSEIFTQNVQTPPLYSISLDTFNKSQAVTQLPSKTPSPYPQYEKWVDSAQKAYAEDRKESRAYGMLNYGDWFGERTYNWGNAEYDTPWCYLQEYLRNGDPQFYTWAEEATRHLIDVDTCHHGAQTGHLYTHSVGHVGNYYPDGYRERALFQGRWSPSHTWVEGPFLYYLLSGDTRTLEGAMKTCDLLIGDILNDYDFTNCRNSGWHLIHLSAAYKTTGRRAYLNAARIIVDRVLERQRDSGGWDRLMVPGHCHCHPPRHMGNAGFMVGMLMVGLKRYHEVVSDKRVADAIVNAADYCIDSMWVRKARSFHYTSCPESRINAGADMRILKGVAYAYGFSKKKRFKDILTAGIKTALGQPPEAHRGVGKGICSPMRGAPQVLTYLPTTQKR